MLVLFEPLAPAGLWKLKSQRQQGKIEGGRLERGADFLFFV